MRPVPESGGRAFAIACACAMMAATLLSRLCAMAVEAVLVSWR